mgnify:FL=1
MGRESEIFFMTWRASNSDNIGLAYSTIEPQSDVFLVPKVIDSSRLFFDFEIRNVKVSSGGLVEIDKDELDGKGKVDYQPNNFAWPIVSVKMKQIIDSVSTAADCISWVQTSLLFNQRDYDYFVLVFNRSYDVIDEHKTLYINKANNHILKPHFSLKKIQDLELSLFRKPFSHNYERITPGIFVTGKLRKHLLEAGVSGIKFEKVAAS